MYLYFAFRLIEIRYDAQMELRRTPREQLERIILSHADYLEGRTGDDEILYQGKMYDISTEDHFPDSVVVYALHDADEDSMLAMLHGMIKRVHHDRKRVPAGLMKVLNAAYDLPAFKISYKENKTERTFTLYRKTYRSVIIPTLNPPPWRA
jgi:hypothetical protein